MDQENALAILESVGAIRRGHFKLATGRCSDVYVEKYNLFPHVELVNQFCREMAGQFADQNVEVVIGMLKGGLILSQQVARYIFCGDAYALSLFAEPSRDGDLAEINHGYLRHLPGKNVLVVEDTLTSGRTVRHVVEAVREARGNVVGVAAIWNRGNVTEADLGNVSRLFSIINKPLGSCGAEKDCPHCQLGTPHDPVSGHAAL